MSLHFNIRIGIRVKDFYQFIKVDLSIIRKIRLVKSKQNVAVEFYNYSFTHAFNLCIRNGFLYFLSLFVHLMTNNRTRGTADCGPDYCTQGSVT